MRPIVLQSVTHSPASVTFRLCPAEESPKYGCDILNDHEKRIGSVIVCEFSSRKEQGTLWLSQEPYVLGDVRTKTEIKPIRTRMPPA